MALDPTIIEVLQFKFNANHYLAMFFRGAARI